MTDKERLNFLQELTNRDNSKVILRDSSTGRGWRLHVTTIAGGKTSVREAIDAAIKADIFNLKTEKKKNL